MNFSNFYFNGRWLSDFGGIVAGNNISPVLSLLPELDIRVHNSKKNDGAIIDSIYVKPRKFTVPIYISDITKLRDIASWLSVKYPAKFYWQGDRLCIYCLTTAESLLTTYTYDGVFEVEFIAHDPYFYLINDLVYTFTNFSNPITFFNDGNVESYPLIKIEGSGNITVTVNNASFTVNNVNGYVYVDSLYQTVTDGLNNLITNFSGSFIQLQSGFNTLSVNGTCNKITITCRSRWI